MKLSAAARRALAIANRHPTNNVYAGWNPGNANVGANTLALLARLGLVTLTKKESTGDTIATLTAEGGRVTQEVGVPR